MTSVSLLYNIYDYERGGRVAQGGHAKVPVRQRQRESVELRWCLDDADGVVRGRVVGQETRHVKRRDLRRGPTKHTDTRAQRYPSLGLL